MFDEIIKYFGKWIQAKLLYKHVDSALIICYQYININVSEHSIDLLLINNS